MKVIAHVFSVILFHFMSSVELTLKKVTMSHDFISVDREIE